MRRSSGFGIIVLVACVAAPAAAADSRFAVRFGLNLLEPTGDSSSNGQQREFDTQNGIQGSFEWYFLNRLGLEAGILGAADVDINDDNDTGGALTFGMLNVGLNAHPIRTETIDWGIGAFGGRASYGDIDWTDSSVSWRSEDDTVWGAQTFLDISIKKGSRWGVGIGLKWISTALELDSGVDIDYDPLVVSVSGVYRWGTRQ
jgi:hypothetical protein